MKYTISVIITLTYWYHNKKDTPAVGQISIFEKYISDNQQIKYGWQETETSNLWIWFYKSNEKWSIRIKPTLHCGFAKLHYFFTLTKPLHRSHAQHCALVSFKCVITSSECFKAYIPRIISQQSMGTWENRRTKMLLSSKWSRIQNPSPIIRHNKTNARLWWINRVQRGNGAKVLSDALSAAVENNNQFSQNRENS